MMTEDSARHPPNPLGPSRFVWWLFVLHFSAALTLWSAIWIDAPAQEERLARHKLVMSGEARGPYQYQVLIPFGLEVARRIGDPIVGADRAFFLAQVLLGFLSRVGCAWCLHRLLLAWLDTRGAFLGVMLYFAVLPMAFSDVYGAPLHYLNDFVFFAGMALLERITHTSGDARRTAHIALLVLLAAGMLNQTWPVFLVAAYLMLCKKVPKRAQPIHDDAGRQPADWRVGMVYMAVTGAVYLLPRYGFGHRDPFRYWTDHLEFNMRHADTLWAGVILLPLWLLGLWNLYRKPWFMRRQFPLAIVYAITLVFGVHLSETTHLVPLLAFLLPAAMILMMTPAADSR